MNKTANIPTNATGWSYLIDGNMIGSVFHMYDFFLNGWTMALIFMVYQIMLFQKTRNLTLGWMTGVFFVVLYGISSVVKEVSLYIIFLILVIQLAGIFYMLLWK